MSERRAKRAKPDAELRRKQALLQVYLRGEATWKEEQELALCKEEDARLWSAQLLEQVTEAAERSDPHAVMLRALMLRYGAGVERDREAGRALLLRAHQLGSRHATYWHASALRKDEKAALLRELLAREPEYVPAITKLAGALSSSDPSESMKLLRQAAGMGDPLVMWSAALRCKDGKYGAQKDLAEAARWLRRRGLAKPADRRPYELLLRIQKKDAEGMVPYGEWRPAWHRWCTPEVRREILTALMLSRRRGLPRQLVVEHLLPYVCSHPRPFVLSVRMQTAVEFLAVHRRMDMMERRLDAQGAKLDAVLELLARK